MPSLHVVIPKDLKRWLETRARREEIDGSVSRYVRRVLTDHRTAVEETASSAPAPKREE